MKTLTKILIVVAILAVIVGGVFFALGIAKEFNNPIELITNSYDSDGDFENIDIQVDVTNLEFKLSTESKTVVECKEREKAYHTVDFENNTLTIKYIDELKWHEKLFGFISPKLTIYLKESTYNQLNIKLSTGSINISNEFSFNDANIKVSTGDVTFNGSVTNNLKLEASTGDIHLNDVGAKTMNLETSTGRITLSRCNVLENVNVKSTTGRQTLEDVTCKNLTINASTGKISLKNTILTEKLTIKASTGDITLDRCDAAEISIETTTGDVNGTLLSDKIFFVQSDTGKPNVPKTTTGGICDVKTDTGDINFSIVN